MEKFAVDLDAVLDEFEYHEGQVKKFINNHEILRDACSFAGISARRRALPLSHWLFLADQRGGLLHIDQLLTKPDLFWTGKLVVPSTPFCCCLCEI